MHHLDSDIGSAVNTMTGSERDQMLRDTLRVLLTDNEYDTVRRALAVFGGDPNARGTTAESIARRREIARFLARSL